MPQALNMGSSIASRSGRIPQARRMLILSTTWSLTLSSLILKGTNTACQLFGQVVRPGESDIALVLQDATPTAPYPATRQILISTGSAASWKSPLTGVTILFLSTVRCASRLINAISSTQTEPTFSGLATPGGWDSAIVCDGRKIFRSWPLIALQRVSRSFKSSLDSTPICLLSTRAEPMKPAFHGKKTMPVSTLIILIWQICELVDRGLAPCIVGCWGYFMIFMGLRKIKQHWRNIVARWGAYPVFWCLAGEGTMPYYLSKNKEEDAADQKRGWTELARYVRSIDPYRHPITIHPSSTARDTVEDPSVLDFDMLQTGHGDR